MKQYPELDDVLGRSVTRLLADIDEASDRLDILRATPVRGGMHALAIGFEYENVRAYRERLDLALTVALVEYLR